MNIDKKDLTDALYLSCVENYFLAWISKFYKVERLYSNSFVSISQVFDDFFCGANYENYSMVERIQNTAEKYGVVSHSYVKLSANEALKFIKNLSGDRLVEFSDKINACFGFAGESGDAESELAVKIVRIETEFFQRRVDFADQILKNGKFDHFGKIELSACGGGAGDIFQRCGGEKNGGQDGRGDEKSFQKAAVHNNVSWIEFKWISH